MQAMPATLAGKPGGRSATYACRPGMRWQLHSMHDRPAAPWEAHLEGVVDDLDLHAGDVAVRRQRACQQGRQVARWVACGVSYLGPSQTLLNASRIKDSVVGTGSGWQRADIVRLTLCACAINSC